MSSKKAGGVTSQHKGLAGKRLGIKHYGGEKVKTGQIIIRQRGTIYKAGEGVQVSRDFTLHAKKDGTVQFKERFGRQIVSII